MVRISILRSTLNQDRESKPHPNDPRNRYQDLLNAPIMSKVAVVDSEGARSRFGTSLGTIPAADT
jgi:hypothetical protein